MIHLPVAASLCIVAVAGAGRDEECDAFAAAAGTEPVPIRRLWPFSQFQWVSPRQWGPIQQTNQPGPCPIQPPGGCTNAQSTCKVGTLLTNHQSHLLSIVSISGCNRQDIDRVRTPVGVKSCVQNANMTQIGSGVIWVALICMLTRQPDRVLHRCCKDMW